MRSQGTLGFPVVASLPASGSLGDVVTLSTDERNYYWHVAAGEWRPVTPIRKIDHFTFGAGPHTLSFPPVPGTEIQAYMDGLFIDPSTYSLANADEFSLTAVDPPFGTDLWVSYVY